MTSVYDYCEQVFARVGFSPHRIPEPADHHVLLGLIADGQGIALAPSSLNTLTRKGVVFQRLAEGSDLSVRLGVAYREIGATAPAMALVEMLKARHSCRRPVARNAASP